MLLVCLVGGCGNFFFLGHWVYDRLSILVGWVIIIKAWTMQMEFGTVHMVSVLLLSEGRPSQRCWWAQVFPTKKKTPIFLDKKNWGGVWERKIATTFRHVGTWGSGPSWVESSRGEGGSISGDPHYGLPSILVHF